jgi:hypothetical protein
MTTITAPRPLGISPTVELSAEELSMAHRIAGYDLSRVEARLIEEGTIPRGWVETSTLEFRRYFTLVALTDEVIPMTSKIVDEVWHTVILFTRLYLDLCLTTAGRFIHHEPADGFGQSHLMDPSVFVSHYTRLFGTPGRIWELQSGAEPPH